jgi:hypothetical protein
MDDVGKTTPLHAWTHITSTCSLEVNYILRRDCEGEINAIYLHALKACKISYMELDSVM